MISIFYPIIGVAVLSRRFHEIFSTQSILCNDSGVSKPFGVWFTGDPLHAWSISNIIDKISPCGRARDAHWPRYQGLAVQAYSGTPAALPMNISNA
jgi:hypothetical protein